MLLHVYHLILVEYTQLPHLYGVSLPRVRYITLQNASQSGTIFSWAFLLFSSTDFIIIPSLSHNG